MTNPVVAEQISAGKSPYEVLKMSGDQLGLPSHIDIHAERWVEPITDLERAREVYSEYGVAILSPDCTVNMGEENVRVGDFTKATAEYTLESLRDHPEIIKKKKYGAYNGTNRNLYTVSYENVIKGAPEVMDLQSAILPTVRIISGDPTIEISTDRDEGTVINLQLFHDDGDVNERQEHGAHTDRVDTTTIVCMDNIGAHGELVFVQGYTSACEELGLSAHRGFKHNIEEILVKQPHALTFRIHDVHPGTMLILRSADDVHFITAKTLGDVRDGQGEPKLVTILNKDGEPEEELIGRCIINMAFETANCRLIDNTARELAASANLFEIKDNDSFFMALDKSLETVDPVFRKSIYNAIVTRRSAKDLYQEDVIQA